MVALKSALSIHIVEKASVVALSNRNNGKRTAGMIRRFFLFFFVKKTKRGKRKRNGTREDNGG